MQYEIDYIPVGTGGKGGDAIAFRYGDFGDRSTQRVVVIDGGTKDSGKSLVDHIKFYYKTNYVDLVVTSHLHNDHISGLTEVLDNLSVKKIALHCPWDHSNEIKRMTNTVSTLGRLESKIEKSLSTLSELVSLSNAKNIKIITPFRGEQILDNLFVLSPSLKYYQSLLPNFSTTPEAKEQHKMKEFAGKLKDAVSWVVETLDFETLSDEYPDTSSENNSSMVLLLVINGKKFLFTGDAGKDSLTNTINFWEDQGIDLSGIDFFDVPHHGSKRNLGPSILDRLSPKLAFISCPPNGDPKHPSRKVINALIRRNCLVCTNRKGDTIHHFGGGAQFRSGWRGVTPETLYSQVEE